MSLTLRKRLDAQAKLDDGHACLLLFEEYQNESGLQAAGDWLDEALDSNSSSAQYVAGVLDLGSGQVSEGISFLKLAAANENVQAMNVLGQLYLGNINGLETATFDLDQGIDYLIQAGLKGSVEAQVILGKCFYLGKWVSRDRFLSALWLEKAAAQGSLEAQQLLDEVLLVHNGLN